MNRRGVSPVVATMLLLVITILLASLIMTFAVPFVQDQLGRSKECLAVIDAVTFADSRFNCHNSTSTPMRTGFSVSISKEGVSGVRVSMIDSSENSNVYIVKNGAQVAALKNIADTNFNTVLQFPAGAGQRTYVANAKYARAEIAPVVSSGRTCAVSDTVEFNECGNGASLP